MSFQGQRCSKSKTERRASSQSTLWHLFSLPPSPSVLKPWFPAQRRSRDTRTALLVFPLLAACGSVSPRHAACWVGRRQTCTRWPQPRLEDIWVLLACVILDESPQHAHRGIQDTRTGLSWIWKCRYHHPALWGLRSKPQTHQVARTSTAAACCTGHGSGWEHSPTEKAGA